jgi:predicted O-methyltransferase YrrM
MFSASSKVDIPFVPDDVRRMYTDKHDDMHLHLNELAKVISSSGKQLEGNAFYKHNTLELYDVLVPKQMNLMWAGSTVKTRICEIGFNAGHSALLFLLTNQETPIDFTVFDIGQHAYTEPCLTYMRNAFPNVTFEYIKGDSIVKVPQWTMNNSQYMQSYDLVHVDGGHSEMCVKNDLKNATKLVAPGGLLVVDDTNYDYINRYVDTYISLGDFEEVFVFPTSGYPHRILRKVKN